MHREVRRATDGGEVDVIPADELFDADADEPRRAGGRAPATRSPTPRRRRSDRRRRCASTPSKRPSRRCAAGRPIVVVDDEDRENEGDLIFAASAATADLVGFMIRHTSGYICVAMTGADLDRLGLPPMTAVNEDRKGTAYAVSVDARDVETHRDLRRRPRAHHQGAVRLGHRAVGADPPGPRDAAARRPRRRPAPRRSHRGRRRPGPHWPGWRRRAPCASWSTTTAR